MEMTLDSLAEALWKVSGPVSLRIPQHPSEPMAGFDDIALQLLRLS